MTLFRFFIFLIATLPSITYANVIVRPELSDQLERSDVVVVATAEQTSTIEKNGINFNFVKFKVSSLLKGGKNIEYVNVDSETNIQEFYVDCCKLGKEYLIFVNENSKVKGMYYTAFGKYSLFIIENEKVVGWEEDKNIPLNNVISEIDSKISK